MESPQNVNVSLFDVSPTTRKLSPEDSAEMAAFGMLVDWELGQLAGRQDWVLRRQSFTWKEDEVLLVVKVEVDELPYVVFVSRSSPISCMRTLVRKMRAGTLKMYPDKYA